MYNFKSELNMKIIKKKRVQGHVQLQI